jgi:DAK2 domain fusion protein YloV
MSTLATLAPADVRRVLETYRDVLRSHQDVVNRLNVYPVPDGDTGTNMALTVESVVAALESVDEPCTMEAICKAVSHGSLMGARGNSGVILSQLLRGLSEKFGPLDAVDAATLAEALVHADGLARKAVVRPVEGTILTVARAAGEGAALALASGADLAGTAEGARAAAEVALAETPELLPALKQAGVVDSGGTGFLLLLDALCHVTAARELPIAPEVESIHVDVTQSPSHEVGDVGDLRYEVMYLLEAPDDTIAAFKEVWAGIGDSIVVVGGDGIYNCHIHTDDIGASIEAAIEIGRPKEIRVTDLAEQVVEERWVREGTAIDEEEPQGPPPETAVVAVVTGDGVGRIFRSLGVQRLVKGGQSMNPSTADLVEAVRATGAANVVILPNNKNIKPVAEQVDALCDEHVVVVPTNSIVEGFAALLSYDPGSDVESNREGMCESAAAVIAAEVTQAVRDSETDAGLVREGDWIGLSKEGILTIADSLVVASQKLLDLLVTDQHELVTLIEGEGSTPSNTRRLSEWLAHERPEVSVEIHHGGQPLYPYLFGIE